MSLQHIRMQRDGIDLMTKNKPLVAQRRNNGGSIERVSCSWASGNQLVTWPKNNEVYTLPERTPAQTGSSIS